MSAIKGLFQTAGHIKNARLATYTHNTNKHKSGPASSARKKPRIFTVSILIHSNTQKMEYPGQIESIFNQHTLKVLLTRDLPGIALELITLCFFP